MLSSATVAPAIRRVSVPYLNPKQDGTDSVGYDDLLDFGDLLFPAGKAFTFTPLNADSGNEPAAVKVAPLQDGDVPVTKQWITTDAPS